MSGKSNSRPIHVVLPDTLIAEIDARTGPRQRGRFIREAIEEKLRHVRWQATLTEMAGSLADAETPGWETPESAAEWVRRLRRGEPVGVIADRADSDSK